MISKKCPLCNGEIRESMLMSNPPIHKKECLRCKQIWTKRETVTDTVFNSEGWETHN
uniref:Uncharacterized protein n=1 Tax=viral metagenome TaxID=1070528 RepID=A0A6M3IFM0_9ZZZZ